MIGWIQGRVVDRNVSGTSGELIVDTGGVGYRLTVIGRALVDAAVGETVTLHVHHHFWEADQRLYGFASPDERLAFVGLLGAHKVGPALALAILSTYNPSQLATILATDDIGSLCEVPGVGKKTAQRLLVDLRSSLVLPVADDEPGEGALAAVDPGVLADVKEALGALGYSAEEIRPALAAVAPEADQPGADAGRLLKVALRSLAEG